MLFFNTVTTISSAFLPAMYKSLHVMLITICTIVGLEVTHCFTAAIAGVFLGKKLPTQSFFHCLVFILVQQVLMNTNACSFLSAQRNLLTPPCFIHTSMSDAVLLPAPLLPSVTQQQNRMEYWWECSASSAVTPTSTSDVVGQQNKS